MWILEKNQYLFVSCKYVSIYTIRMTMPTIVQCTTIHRK